MKENLTSLRINLTDEKTNEADSSAWFLSYAHETNNVGLVDIVDSRERRGAMFVARG